MATIKWTARAAATTLASTEINALASGSYATGPEIDNGTNLNQMMDVDLILASAVTTGTGAPYVGIYLVPTLDGTNYPTLPAATVEPPAIYFAAAIPFTASTSFTRGSVVQVEIPPGKWKVLVRNVLGVAFPATGNLAYGYQYNEQSV